MYRNDFNPARTPPKFSMGRLLAGIVVLLVVVGICGYSTLKDLGGANKGGKSPKNNGIVTSGSGESKTFRPRASLSESERKQFNDLAQKRTQLQTQLQSTQAILQVKRAGLEKANQGLVKYSNKTRSPQEEIDYDSVKQMKARLEKEISNLQKQEAKTQSDLKSVETEMQRYSEDSSR
jgi:hypothetical protein